MLRCLTGLCVCALRRLALERPGPTPAPGLAVLTLCTPAGARGLGLVLPLRVLPECAAGAWGRVLAAAVAPVLMRLLAGRGAVAGAWALLFCVTGAALARGALPRAGS